MKQSKIAVLTAALLLSSTASAIPSNSLHSLKGDNRVGTNIPAVQAQSSIPFNKSFDNLSQQEQNLVRAQFDDLGVNDTPPFPSKGLQSIYKPIIKANQRYSAKGTLSLNATVDASGQITSIEVNQSPSKALSRKVERVLSSVKFDAASCDGNRCEMSFPVNIQFN